MRIAHTILLPLFVSMSTNAFAEVTTDDRLWLSTAVRAEPTEDVRTQFTQHVRLPLAGEYNRQIIPAIEVEYAGITHLSVGAGARYAFETLEDDETMQVFRVYGDLGLYTPDLGPIELGYRLRYQNDSSPNMDEPKNRLRNRLNIQISTGSIFRPGAFYEHFIDPNGEANEKAKKFRIGADLGIKIDQNHRLKIKFLQDTEIDGDGDKVRVVALGYRYSV